MFHGWGDVCQICPNPPPILPLTPLTPLSSHHQFGTIVPTLRPSAGNPIFKRLFGRRIRVIREFPCSFLSLCLSLYHLYGIVYLAAALGSDYDPPIVPSRCHSPPPNVPPWSLHCANICASITPLLQYHGPPAASCRPM